MFEMPLDALRAVVLSIGFSASRMDAGLRLPLRSERLSQGQSDPSLRSERFPRVPSSNDVERHSRVRPRGRIVRCRRDPLHRAGTSNSVPVAKPRTKTTEHCAQLRALGEYLSVECRACHGRPLSSTSYRELPPEAPSAASAGRLVIVSHVDAAIGIPTACTCCGGTTRTSRWWRALSRWAAASPRTPAARARGAPPRSGRVRPRGGR